jgi:hypothetical protein
MAIEIQQHLVRSSNLATSTTIVKSTSVQK